MESFASTPILDAPLKTTETTITIAFRDLPESDGVFYSLEYFTFPMALFAQEISSRIFVLAKGCSVRPIPQPIEALEGRLCLTLVSWVMGESLEWLIPSSSIHTIMMGEEKIF